MPADYCSWPLKEPKTLEITLTRTTDVDALLTVAIAEQDYLDSYKKRVKELVQKGQFKGFRPGKVPASHVERMYGTSLRVEAVNDILGKSVDAYIKDNNLAILGQPLPATGDAQPEIDWKNGKDYTFVFELGMSPAMELPTLDTFALNTYTIDVNDENVQQTLQNLRRRFGKTIVPETSEHGDELYGELRKEDGSWSTKTMVPTNKLNASAISLFVGKKEGDEISFVLTDAFDTHQIQHLTSFSKEEAAAVTGTYVFKISNMNRQELAAVDAELFKQVFPYEQEEMTEEVFMSRLREEVAKAYEQDSNQYRSEAIKKEVMKHASFTLPVDFLHRWLLASNEKLTKEDLDRQMDYFLEDLRWTLVRDHVLSSQFGIEPSYETVLEFHKERSKAMFAQYGMGADEEQLESIATRFTVQQLTENKGEKYNKMAQEALDALFFSQSATKVQITAMSVSVEEFEDKMHHLIAH